MCDNFLKSNVKHLETTHNRAFILTNEGDMYQFSYETQEQELELVSTNVSWISKTYDLWGYEFCYGATNLGKVIVCEPMEYGADRIVECEDVSLPTTNNIKFVRKGCIITNDNTLYICSDGVPINIQKIVNLHNKVLDATLFYLKSHNLIYCLFLDENYDLYIKKCADTVMTCFNKIELDLGDNFNGHVEQFLDISESTFASPRKLIVKTQEKNGDRIHILQKNDNKLGSVGLYSDRINEISLKLIFIDNNVIPSLPHRNVYIKSASNKF